MRGGGEGERKTKRERKRGRWGEQGRVYQKNNTFLLRKYEAREMFFLNEHTKKLKSNSVSGLKLKLTTLS